MASVGNSSGGMVITGVADRAPERIGRLVYLDAFVPEDGQCLLDLVPPDRRPAMEALVAVEGAGWLLPRFAAAPWERFVPEVWQVTDAADLRWVLARLAPTPFGRSGSSRSGLPTPTDLASRPLSRTAAARVIAGWLAGGLRLLFGRHNVFEQ